MKVTRHLWLASSVVVCRHGALGDRALTLHGTASLPYPNEHSFHGIGGITHDAPSDSWTGISEGGNPGEGLQQGTENPRIFVFDVRWKHPAAAAAAGGGEGGDDDDEEEEGRGAADDGTIRVRSVREVRPGDGLKTEGIARVPRPSAARACAGDGNNATAATAERDPETTEYWLVSESNSDTERTNSYFSKRFGHVDPNTYVPGSRRDSRFVRVSSDGTLLEEIPLPEWMLWDGVFHWDMEQCYGNRVLKGLHSLTLYEPKEGEQGGLLTSTQLVMMNQIALYQDGAEPTVFEGSHVRIMFWDVASSSRRCNDDVLADGEGGGTPSAALSPSAKYSRSYRYQTSPLLIDTFQKGARHVRGVFGLLALSATEFLVAETELLEGFGIVKFISDIFYVKVNFNDTVDHCDSLADCADVDVPVKRHLLRRDHPYEMSDIAWGPSVERNGAALPTIAIAFEDANAIGVLMELYMIDAANLEIEPLWDARKDSSAFIRQRSSVLLTACLLFAIGLILQFWWVRRDIAKKASEERGDGHQAEGRSRKLGYKDYVLVSAVANSCLLGGIVFGLPGLVMILRREGVHAEMCSCGVYCAGQQEQMAMLSTLGFAAAISSRLFAGLFMDKFGPKITAVVSGLVSVFGLILLATAKDVSLLTERITPAWIILAVGGSSMHLTSFHVTNLQGDPADKRKASLFISAGFGAGSLLLPVLQVINQYGGISLQTICSIYAAVAFLLTANSFIVQPWRAWNALKSEGVLDANVFRRSWWPSSISMLTAVKRSSSAKFPPLGEVLRSFEMWGECFWFSSQLFLLTYYLSTISQVLFALGDARVNQDVDSLQNNMFTRACLYFNGLGWLWSPCVGHLMVTRSIYFRIYLEISMAVVMSILLTIPIIELQVVVFLLQPFVRLQVFSNHYAYLAERFGFRHFGLLNGISSLVAGTFGLLGYTLQIFSVYIANGNYGLSYFIVAGLVFSSTIFPIVLKRKDQAAVPVDEIETKPQTPELDNAELSQVDVTETAVGDTQQSSDQLPVEGATPSSLGDNSQSMERQEGQRDVARRPSLLNQALWIEYD